ncbi:H/ACA ribonucleoprotein complex subunit 3-like [Hippocampus zosterae]|uniref:H/ACA ribonucleoprotein complex subunit 3-like n=1 Tax=Hippocampus zosterae TaxID=109293 RepID=UPI00223D63B9|nr:H/ACA ribonucleoprotein complex subunit 3-like [Hippocampus zosterae]
MLMRYVEDEQGIRVYTLQEVVDGRYSLSAHPAHFSPDDQYSKQRLLCKERYGLLPTQQPPIQF